jgi:hypothetical protein
MGFYFRKSLRFGPLRFNLSRRGVGVSAGVKGFRIGRRAHGKDYVAAGREGIYYRGNLDAGGRSTSWLGWLLLVVVIGAFLTWLAGCAATAPRSTAPNVPNAPEISPTTTPDLDRVSLPSRIFALVAPSIASAADLPAHAIALDRYGTWTCERGYVLTNHRCVAESELPHGPQFEVSTLPSAGGGSLQPSADASATASSEARAAAPAPSSEPLYIQTNQPWTVVLDAAGNPSAVIVGGPRDGR